jgi:hypothetical protein
MPFRNHGQDAVMDVGAPESVPWGREAACSSLHSHLSSLEIKAGQEWELVQHI